MGNHLGPFSEASDQPKGQKLAGGAVGSQEGLQQVKFVLGSNSPSEHGKTNVLGYGESFSTIFRSLRST